MDNVYFSEKYVETMKKFLDDPQRKKNVEYAKGFLGSEDRFFIELESVYKGLGISPSKEAKG